MRTALVTGASRGIGRATAVELARQGYGLMISSRSVADLEPLDAELAASGSPRVVHAAADLADTEALPAVVALHHETFGSMDALVANAGVGSAGPVASYRLDRLRKTMAINFEGAFVLIQHALPLLRAAATASPERGAKIVALSSITGVYAEDGLAAYGASKAALLSLVEAVNLEESGRGVTASAIAPGFVDTDMAAWVTDRVPANEMIPVADVVAVIGMLLGLSASSSITRIVMSRSGTSGREA